MDSEPFIKSTRYLISAIELEGFILKLQPHFLSGHVDNVSTELIHVPNPAADKISVGIGG